ncbi:hypothetical protein EXM65_02700 [Clostridium botulinum]|uniref:Uncharacterized protein n=1 Tax=Clostridium botulinum TaxID=1491 RepID=A0A6M0SP45_CLOBO|nr:hypothetical protein [Clostridium botulinum]
MAVKGIGNICKSPGNISNMGSGSLPILNGTKGTLAISSSVEIANIGSAVRTGIGGAELGLGTYNFSKGSNNASSKETDKNNNAANKKDYEKESSSNNKGKDIENKVQGNENEGGSKARIADDILDKELLDNVNIMKDKLPSWAKNKGNFGYSEADIEEIDKTEYFAHSSIQTEIPSVKGSGISVKTESSPFKANRSQW